MGELAKIRRILEGISADYDNKHNDNSGSDSFGEIRIKNSATDDNNHSTKGKSYGMEQSSLEEQDVGERIQRVPLSKVEAVDERAVIGPSRSKKTRQVHANEIDQLFDGLA